MSDTATPSYPSIALLIGGQWRERPGTPVFNPSDESQIGESPRATEQDIEEAVAAAAAAYLIWKHTPPAVRAATLRRAAELLRQRVDAIAPVITLEEGKPLGEARAEVLRASDLIEWDAEEGRRAYGRTIPRQPGFRDWVLREPIGPVAALTPWNAPVLSPARKVAGALAAGCSIVLKASEETPGGAVLLARAFEDAGLPPGVLNLVFGDPAGISERLIRDPSIRLITFTGSVPVGKRLTSLAGSFMKPVIMELGGHAPVIVCEDADLDLAARTIVSAKIRNAGQVCVSPTRLFCTQSIAAEFEECFSRELESVRIGDGFDRGVNMGPLANRRRALAIKELVDDAVRQGADLVARVDHKRSGGYFHDLTVLKNVPASARASREEPFGPIAMLCTVPDLSTAIAQANAVPYALSGYAFTHSAAAIERLAAELEVGALSINHAAASFAETPFGGIKDSGIGREGGVEGLGCYTVTKSISYKLPN